MTRKVLSDWWRSASCLEFALLPLLKYHNACAIPDDEIKQDKIYLAYCDSWNFIIIFIYTKRIKCTYYRLGPISFWSPTDIDSRRNPSISSWYLYNINLPFPMAKNAPLGEMHCTSKFLDKPCQEPNYFSQYHNSTEI